MKILGVLPAVGSGLDTMAKAGQLGRLMAYVGAWRDAVDEIRYFSYLSPDVEFRASATRQGRCWQLSEVCCVPSRSWTRALRRPCGPERWKWRDLAVMRCMNLLAAVPALTANAIWGVPFVVSYGADYETIARIHGDGRQAWKWRLLRAIVFRRAAVVLVPSRQQLEILCRRYQRASVTFRYHPNWVDLDLFRQRQPVAPDGARHIYYWGRLVTEKNLVRAARACRAAGATLCCIGDGPEAQAIRDAGGAVVPTCDYEHIPRAVAMADAFILPSLSEGHPKALLEAMALGLPCLVSERVPGIWPSRRFDPTNETDIAKAVQAVLRDLSYTLALGEAGRQYVERDFEKWRWLGAEAEMLGQLAQR